MCSTFSSCCHLLKDVKKISNPMENIRKKEEMEWGESPAQYNILISAISIERGGGWVESHIENDGGEG